GDDVLRTQIKTLLTTYHTKRLFPSDFVPQTDPASINSLSTFTIDNSELLEEFKTAYRADTEWREALKKGDGNFTLHDDLVFHEDRTTLFYLGILVELAPMTTSIVTTLGPDSVATSALMSSPVTSAHASRTPHTSRMDF
ncbi:hypothetical protein DXG01_014677, partial [Tephrocybe rancida]